MTSYRDQGFVPIVVVAFGAHVVGMHARTGARVWEHDTSWSIGPLRITCDGDRVFVLSGTKLTSLEHATGALFWTTTVPATVSGSGPSLLAYAGTVVVADMGEAAGYAQEDGELLWHDEFEGYGIASVALAVPGASSQIDRRR